MGRAPKFSEGGVFGTFRVVMVIVYVLAGKTVELGIEDEAI